MADTAIDLLSAQWVPPASPISPRTGPSGLSFRSCARPTPPAPPRSAYRRMSARNHHARKAAASAGARLVHPKQIAAREPSARSRDVPSRDRQTRQYARLLSAACSVDRCCRTRSQLRRNSLAPTHQSNARLLPHREFARSAVASPPYEDREHRLPPTSATLSANIGSAARRGLSIGAREFDSRAEHAPLHAI